MSVEGGRDRGMTGMYVSFLEIARIEQGGALSPDRSFTKSWMFPSESGDERMDALDEDREERMME